MTKIIDITTQTMGANNPFQIREISQITHIGIHHSATITGDQFIFENYWKSLGWRNGGYSEIILRNGDVQMCYVPTTVTNGIAGHNVNTYHICCVGNGSFTMEQEISLMERVKFNIEKFNIPTARVMGHNEFPGTATACPGRDMNSLRNKLNSTVTPVTPPSIAGDNTYTGDSLVDYLKSINVDSSFENRKILANQNGIGNYTGTANQNIHLLNILRDGNTIQTSVQYYPAFTSTSIVDGLKSINVDSSMANRTAIATKNNIVNYSGTAAQNTQLLKLAKQGKLIRT